MNRYRKHGTHRSLFSLKKKEILQLCDNKHEAREDFVLFLYFQKISYNNYVIVTFECFIH